MKFERAMIALIVCIIVYCVIGSSGKTPMDRRIERDERRDSYQRAMYDLNVVVSYVEEHDDTIYTFADYREAIDSLYAYVEGGYSAR